MYYKLNNKKDIINFVIGSRGCGKTIQLPIIIQDNEGYYNVYFFNKRFGTIDSYRYREKVDALLKFQQLKEGV